MVHEKQNALYVPNKKTVLLSQYICISESKSSN